MATEHPSSLSTDTHALPVTDVAHAQTTEHTESVGFEPPTLASETVGHIGAFEIRNTMLNAWLAMIVLILIAVAYGVSSKKKGTPGRFAMFVEMVIGGLFDFFDGIVQNARQTRMIFPLVATIFLFLITGNWMGILPGVGSITIAGMHEGHAMNIPLFRSMNADVNMTLAIAIITFFATQIFGMHQLGFWHYAGKFFVPPWKDPIGFFVGLLEIVGEFARVISFTFRLFGNIFAGEVLLVVISYLVPYLAPVPFLGMELFVGFIQALVFAMLALVFLKMAATGHGDHAEHDASLSPAHA